MYRIVRELSHSGRPADAPRCTSRRPMRPTPSRPAATPSTPPSAAPRASSSLLDERELRGVLGHELSHVYNRDILISSVAAALASVDHVPRAASPTSPLGGGDDDDGPQPDRASLLVPSSARSPPRSSSWRSAGPGSTRPTSPAPTLTRDPLALASALRKIEPGVAAAPLPPEPQLQTTSALMIANPFKRRRVAAVLDPPADRGADRPARGDGVRRLPPRP